MSALRLRQDGVACSDLGDEIVILDLRSSTYFSARGTGAVLVTALQSGASVDTLVGDLRAAYDVTEDVAREDVVEFVADLERRGLLESLDA